MTRMCGRFTLRASAEQVAEQFALFEVPPFAPRYNIAPTQPAPVVRLGASEPESVTRLAAGEPPPVGRSAAGEPRPAREFVLLHWGLIPHWAKDRRIGNRMINARAESVLEKPAFRDAMRRRRCLVVADGFYEWRKTGDGKQPYFIHRQDDRPFAFAGLWESWQGPEDEPLQSCTILTTQPTRLLKPIHDRMPVILPAEHYEPWLDPAGRAQDLAALLEPCESEPLEAYPVSPLVNSPRNDSPQCVERLRG